MIVRDIEMIGSLILSIVWAICTFIAVTKAPGFINQFLMLILWLVFGAIIFGIYGLITKIVTRCSRR